MGVEAFDDRACGSRVVRFMNLSDEGRVGGARILQQPVLLQAHPVIGVLTAQDLDD
jgi:hypothetical protein